jgi:hypothetical protein
MIRTLCALVFLAVATVAAPAEPMTLHSTYDATGTNPDNSKYSGTVTIKVISDASFTIHWNINGETYDGFGIRNADALAATYEINGEPGLVIYKVDDDGVFHGLWAVRGGGVGGTERLVPHH